MAGLADFNALLASGDPAFANAWDTINSQLSSEGADDTAINAAKGALADSFDQLSQSMGVDAGTALNAAKQYVLEGQTVAGAIDHVVGLVQAAQSGAPPAQTMQGFIGVAIGLLATVGPLSAGVGAAIVATAGAIIDILNQAGLFGEAPSGTTICPDVIVNGPLPNWIYTAPWPVGFVQPCTGFYGDKIATGSSDWRTFPDITSKIDWAVWYVNYGPVSNWGPRTAPLSTTYTAKANPYVFGANGPIIFSVFPELNHLLLENGQMPGISRGLPLAGITDFQKMFFSAWKVNRALILNGLKPLDDYKVLLQAVRTWNRANKGAPMYSLPPADPSVGTSYWQQAFPAVPFEAIVLRDLLHSGSYPDIVVNGNLQIAMATAPTKAPNIPGLASSSTQLSTVGKVAVGAATVAGVGILGLGIYAWLTQQSIGYTFGKVVDGTRDLLRGVAHEANEAREFAAAPIRQNPYRDLDDLPASVHRLPRRAQRIWRSAFNSACSRYRDEHRCFAIAWGAVRNAGY